MMRYSLATILVLQASLGLADETGVGNYLAPGRVDRIFAKRAPADFGTFKVDCKGSESACNNACYHIRCLVSLKRGNLLVLKAIADQIANSLN